MKMGRSIAVIAGLTVVASLAQSAMAAITIQASAVPFVDISGTGTALVAPSDDSETVLAGATHNWVGNGLFAGGVSIRIGNNGAIVWGNSATDTFTGATEIGYYNAAPLNSTAPAEARLQLQPWLQPTPASRVTAAGVRQFVAPLWEDYFPVTGGATTRHFWQVIGNDLIVQYHREDAFTAQGAGDVTFQAIFRGGVAINSGQSLVDFVYNDTLFQASQYQNDGGGATIGYKNWGLMPGANDVEYGIGGGGPLPTSDPTFAAGTGMQPKVGGWALNSNPNLPHSVSITPEPATLSLLAFGAIALIRRRR